MRQRAFHRDLLSAGQFVFLGDAGDNRINLAFGVLPRRTQFGIGGLALGMVRAILLGRVRQAAFSRRFDALELNVNRALLNRGNRLDVGLGLLRALHLLIGRLGLRSLLSRGNQAP